MHDGMGGPATMREASCRVITAPMMQIGDRLPDATLYESTEFGDACPLPPAKHSAAALAAGKRIAVFGVPGPFTPTCSAKHLPGYLANAAALKAKGVDEIWCVAVNDGYVMAAWGREQKALGAIRFFGDGAAEWTKKLGIDAEYPGMGVRCRRFSMLVEDGVIRQFQVEQPGKFEVSNAETLLAQLG
jgi:peroxiredoxin